MFIIDTHCHLDRIKYQNNYSNINNLIDFYVSKNIGLMLSVCVSLNNFYEIKNKIGSNKRVIISCGIHPLEINNKNINYIELENLSSLKIVKAIGETGLDYHISMKYKKKQQESFIQHINISKKYKKPIIIHSRNSSLDILNILKKEKINDTGAIFHCFTYDIKFLKLILDLNLYVSFSGILTFNNTEHIKNAVKYIPINRLLAETDSPFLSPFPYRGRENQPIYIIEILKLISYIKNISLKKLIFEINTNFFNLFKKNKLNF